MFHVGTVIILITATFHTSKSLDHCTDHTLLLDDGSRSVKSGPGSDKCDRYINDAWYKVMSEECPLRMSTTPVPPNRCSAVYPIWLRGEYPEESDGVVNMTACVSTFGNNCVDEIQIQVANCSSFLVFYLVHTSGCPERYCFDNSSCLTMNVSVPTDDKESQPNGTINETEDSKSSNLGDLDPCTDHKILLDDGSRSVESGPGSDKCDRYINDAWYKVMSEECPLRMPTTPVSANRCSAVYPIWLRGEYPDVNDGIVNMTACVSTLDNDCVDELQIQIANCSSFLAFYLVHTRGCPERYCFDKSSCVSSNGTDSPTVDKNSQNATIDKNSQQNGGISVLELTTVDLISTEKATGNGNDVPVVPHNDIMEGEGAESITGTFVGIGIGSAIAAAVITSVVWFICLYCKRRRSLRPTDNNHYMEPSASNFGMKTEDRPYTNLSAVVIGETEIEEKPCTKLTAANGQIENDEPPYTKAVSVSRVENEYATLGD